VVPPGSRWGGSDAAQTPSVNDTGPTGPELLSMRDAVSVGCSETRGELGLGNAVNLVLLPDQTAHRKVEQSLQCFRLSRRRH
jgi:hypothetical protein